MIWNDHSREMPDGFHAFLSPSSHSWINYSDERLMEVYGNKMAAARGTKLHELASKLVGLQVFLPEEEKTLNMYVNDMIRGRLSPERKLYYSKFCNGTADGIGVLENVLHVYDLKTGKIPASFLQLEIYASLFLLEYPEYKITSLDGIELRIYQNNEVRIENPGPDIIVPIMDKITHFSRALEILEAEFNDGDIPYRSWA